MGFEAKHMPERRSAQPIDAGPDFTPRAKLRKLPESWTGNHDERLREAKGRYAKIAKLSDEWGIAEGALITRWHRFRSGEVVARPCGKGASLDDLLQSVTPAMSRICLTLHRHGPLNITALSDALSRTRGALTATIEQNAERMAALGWEITSGSPVALRQIKGCDQ